MVYKYIDTHLPGKVCVSSGDDYISISNDISGAHVAFAITEAPAVVSAICDASGIESSEVKGLRIERDRLLPLVRYLAEGWVNNHDLTDWARNALGWRSA